jgi:HK97 family phage prohead protease
MEIITRRPQEVKVGTHLYRSSVLKAVDAKDGVFEFVASDETVDRYGDVIVADKWELANYKRNPIVLFGHSSRDPIGKALKTWVEDKQLKVRIKFAELGTSAWIDTVRKLAEQDILKAVSVGFAPTVDPEIIRDEKNDYITGYRFVGQELLENSLVSVPANPNALSLMKQMGVSQEMQTRLVAPDVLVQAKVRARYLELLRLGAASRSTFRKEML